MKKVLVLVALLVGCGGSSKGPQCSLTDKGARPRVSIAWHVAHGSMDEDPPRPRVKVSFTGASQSEVDLGELAGTCALVEVGAQLEEPVYGSKVTELGCTHGKRSTHATLFLEGPGKVVVKRWERTEGGEGLEKVREVATVEVPTCAVFSADMAQAGDL